MKYYELLTTIKNQLANDDFVNTVTEGDIFGVDLKKQTIFPLSHIMVNSATTQTGVINFSITVLCMDVVDKSKEEETDVFIGNDNEQDVMNTQLAVAMRLMEVFKRGSNTRTFELVGDPNYEPFRERFENFLAGWAVSFNIQIPNDMTACTEFVESVLCEGVTYSITNDEGTVLYSGSIDSGGSLTQAISDATAVLKDTAGVTISTTSINAEGSANITAPDASYSNSDASYSGNVVSGGSLSIPDSDVNVNGSLEGSLVSVKDVDINVTDSSGAVTPDSVSIVGNTVTIDVPVSAPIRAKPLITGQTTSYVSEDDGATQRGRLVDFFTLSTNNAFGNTNRFTDLTGGQTFASNGVFLDHSTDNGSEILAFTNSPTNNDWAGTITIISSQSTDGKTDWYMPNRSELELLINEAANPNLNWTPLTTVATPFSGNLYCWTSTTPINNTARAKAFYSSTAIDGNEMRTYGKTLASRSLSCRYYSYAELGL